MSSPQKAGAVNRDILRLAALTLMVAVAVGMAVRIAAVLAESPGSFAPHLHDKYVTHYALILTHGIAGCTALGIGAFQFVRSFRRRFTVLHRYAGSFYLLCVAVSGISGFRMALMAYGGWIARTGFVLLDTLWLSTGAVALVCVLRGDVAAHGKWMIRNYAFTFSAVMVRVWLTAAERMDLPLEATYAAVAWLSWVPTVIIVEAYRRHVEVVRST